MRVYRLTTECKFEINHLTSTRYPVLKKTTMINWNIVTATQTWLGGQPKYWWAVLGGRCRHPQLGTTR
jgi:hypothetical protein